MNWLILISAGLCEVGFTYCLGRAKEVVGGEWWSWIAAFSFFYVLSAVLLARATQVSKSAGALSPQTWRRLSMTYRASLRRQPAEDRQMGMNIESCYTESSNKWTGER
jgi:hypothetical protein